MGVTIWGVMIACSRDSAAAFSPHPSGGGRVSSRRASDWVNRKGEAARGKTACERRDPLNRPDCQDYRSDRPARADPPTSTTATTAPSARSGMRPSGTTPRSAPGTAANMATGRPTSCGRPGAEQPARTVPGRTGAARIGRPDARKGCPVRRTWNGAVSCPRQEPRHSPLPSSVEPNKPDAHCPTTSAPTTDTVRLMCGRDTQNQTSVTRPWTPVAPHAQRQIRTLPAAGHGWLGG